MFASTYIYLLLSAEIKQQVKVHDDSIWFKNCYLHLQESQISQWKASATRVSRREIDGIEVSYFLSMFYSQGQYIHHVRIISK